MKKSIAWALAVCLCLLCGTVCAAAQPPHLSLNAVGAVVAPGATATLTLDAESVTGYLHDGTESPVTGYQYDVYLDAGLTFVGDQAGDALPADWTYRFVTNEAGDYAQLLAFTPGISAYDSLDGAVAQFQVKVDADVAVGTKLKIYLVNSGGTVAGSSGNLDARPCETAQFGGESVGGVVQMLELTVAEQSITPGDVDTSSKVDVGDIMKLKALIMADKWSEEELALGDMDGSGKLDVGDIMAIKNIIMNH